MTQLSEVLFSTVSDIAFTIYTDNGKEPVIKADVRTLCKVRAVGCSISLLKSQTNSDLCILRNPAGKDRKQRNHLGICQ